MFTTTVLEECPNFDIIFAIIHQNLGATKTCTRLILPNLIRRKQKQKQAAGLPLTRFRLPSILKDLRHQKLSNLKKKSQ